MRVVYNLYKRAGTFMYLCADMVCVLTIAILLKTRRTSPRAHPRSGGVVGEWGDGGDEATHTHKSNFAVVLK